MHESLCMCSYGESSVSIHCVCVQNCRDWHFLSEVNKCLVDVIISKNKSCKKYSYGLFNGKTIKHCRCFMWGKAQYSLLPCSNMCLLLWVEPRDQVCVILFLQKSEWMFFISSALLKVIFLVFLQFSALISDCLFIIIYVAPFQPFIFYKLCFTSMNPLFEVVNKYTQGGNLVLTCFYALSVTLFWGE